MSIVNRSSIPEEFFDITSAMLLVQPEPQYFHAMLFKMALSQQMMLSTGGLGMPIPGRQIQDSGDAYTNAQFDRLMLAPPDPIYSDAVQMVPEIGAQVGHTVKLNRPKFGSGGFTLASREVASGQTISTTAIDLASEQVSLTIKRYAGPYDAVAGAVAPFAVDRFDASRMKHSAVQLVGKHLQRDLDRWLDQSMVSLMNLASTTLWPQGFTSDNGSAVAGDMPMDCDLLFRAEETLKNANIPRFRDGTYMAVIGPTQARQLKGDPQFVAFAKEDPTRNPMNPIFNSYVGKVGGIRVFESTSLIATNNSSSVPVFSSQVFGPGALGAGVGRLPEVVANSADNYGESAFVLWLCYMALGLLDNRMVINLHTS